MKKYILLLMLISSASCANMKNFENMTPEDKTNYFINNVEKNDNYGCVMQGLVKNFNDLDEILKLSDVKNFKDYSQEYNIREKCARRINDLRVEDKKVDDMSDSEFFGKLLGYKQGLNMNEDLYLSGQLKEYVKAFYLFDKHKISVIQNNFSEINKDEIESKFTDYYTKNLKGKLSPNYLYNNLIKVNKEFLNKMITKERVIIDRKYGKDKKLCSNESVFEMLYEGLGRNIDKSCIFHFTEGNTRLSIIQSTKGGVLAQARGGEGNYYMLGDKRTFFIETNKDYADGDLYNGIVIYDGNYQYNNFFTGNKKVVKFKEIDFRDFYFIYKK